jgi:hypothetical protein
MMNWTALILWSAAGVIVVTILLAAAMTHHHLFIGAVSILVTLFIAFGLHSRLQKKPKPSARRRA